MNSCHSCTQDSYPPQSDTKSHDPFCTEDSCHFDVYHHSLSCQNLAKHPHDDKPIDDRPASPKDSSSIAKRPCEIMPVNNKLPSSLQLKSSLDLFNDLFDIKNYPNKTKAKQYHHWVNQKSPPATLMFDHVAHFYHLESEFLKHEDAKQDLHKRDYDQQITPVAVNGTTDDSHHLHWCIGTMNFF